MTEGKPLSGVRILDFTQLLPGPMCTLHLADLGAEVIKIEPPKGGDPTRGLGGAGGEQRIPNLFLMLNRNKRSVALDLRSEEGVAALRRLAATADVVVEGFRPGVMDRLGIGYAALSALNPRLVYCSITGYGQDGPLAQAAGHDINYQSLAGVLDQSGGAGGPPAQGNFPIADLVGGALSSAVGILAALYDARAAGKGRRIDVSMTDCLLAHNVIAAAAWRTAGRPVPRGADYLSGGLACYGTYRTADDRYLAVGAIEIKFWQAFCATIGRPDLVARGHVPGKAGAEARAEVAAVIAGATLAEWQERFATVDACVTPVLTLEEVADHPNTRARGMAVTADHPVAGLHLEFAFPIRMSGFAFQASPAPALGADNAALLADATA